VQNTESRDSALRKIGTFQGHLHEVWALAVSPDGKTLVSGGKDGTARFWSGVPKADEGLLPEARLPLKFSDDARRLLAVNRDGTLSYWDIRSRDKSGIIDLAFETNGFGPVAFSSDLKRFAVGTTNATVELWNIEPRQHIATRRVNGGEVYFLSFSPKDNFLMAQSVELVNGIWKNTATVLNLSTGQPPSQLEQIFFGSAFSPDETLVAIPMSDSAITVLDVTMQRKLAVLKGHTWGTRSLAFSPDGKWLMSASHDNTIRLWDTKSWQQLDVLRGHMGGVSAAAFSADGTIVASVSSDHVLKLWDVSQLPARELVSITLRTALSTPLSVMLSPDKNVLAVDQGLEGVLLLRAPAFAEIEAREKAKAEATATVGSAR
jgi:WD40 repeat protein